MSEKKVKCKDCVHFHLDFWGEIPGLPMPIIIAHEICDYWANGCKTEPEGFCYKGAEKEDKDGQ